MNKYNHYLGGGKLCAVVLLLTLSFERSSGFSSLCHHDPTPHLTHLTQARKSMRCGRSSPASSGNVKFCGRTYRPSRIGIQFQFMANSNDEENTNREISDEARRKLLLSPLLLQAAAAFPFLITNTAQPQPAFADDNIMDIDQKKVVMQMSSQNIPTRYSSSTSTSTSSTSSIDGTATATTETLAASEFDLLTEDELRRIAVFEKAAPSVVYIDTFVEQRDVFSTNVMEVPVGTGSGFVWDDKGHIVTNCEYLILVAELIHYEFILISFPLPALTIHITHHMVIFMQIMWFGQRSLLKLVSEY